MKPLSNSELGEIRSLYEQVHSSQEVIEEELVYEICEELVEELIEEGYSEEEAIEIVDEATDLYIDEAKVTFGSDTAPMRKSGAAVGARRRFARRKAGEALGGAKKAAGDAAKGVMGKAKSKVAGAAVDASLAYDAAKKKAGEVKKAVSDAPTKVARAAARGTEKVEKKVKSGIKGLIGRAAKKVASKASAVASRMSEEIEALKESGKFSEKEIEAIMNVDMSEGYKEIDAKKHGRMYDRYKKLRSAAIKDARDSGEASGTNRMKMGKMSAVIDKSSENLRKKQTKDQLTGRG